MSCSTSCAAPRRWRSANALVAALERFQVGAPGRRHGDARDAPDRPAVPASARRTGRRAGGEGVAMAIARPLQVESHEEGERVRLDAASASSTSPRCRGWRRRSRRRSPRAPRQLVVDLRSLGFLDSSGLRQFIVLADRAARGGLRARARAPGHACAGDLPDHARRGEPALRRRAAAHERAGSGVLCAARARARHPCSRDRPLGGRRAAACAGRRRLVRPDGRAARLRGGLERRAPLERPRRRHDLAGCDRHRARRAHRGHRRRRRLHAPAARPRASRRRLRAVPGRQSGERAGAWTARAARPSGSSSPARPRWSARRAGRSSTGGGATPWNRPPREPGSGTGSSCPAVRRAGRR